MMSLFVDSEYGWKGADRCASAFVPVQFGSVNLNTDERRSFFGRHQALSRFIDDHRHDLFVSHNLIAEATYLLRLGITPPTNWWDTMLGFRYLTNAEVVQPYALESVLAHYGIPHRYAAEKDRLQKWIGRLEFDPSNPDDRWLIRDYNLADCESTAALYQVLKDKVPADWMRRAVAFALATARMELRGMAFDADSYGEILECKDEVIEAVTGPINRVCPVFVNGQLKRQPFLSWCASRGIGWPAYRDSKTGHERVSLDRRAFERMKNRHPFIAKVHEAKKTCTQLNKRSLTVDFARRRHYFGNIPFAASSGRTGYKAAILSAPKWERYLLVPSSPEHVLLSTDIKAEEIAVVAWLSGDQAMMQGYRDGDPHRDFAVRSGALTGMESPEVRKQIRDKYKAVNLAVNYLASAYGLAQQTGLYIEHAQRLLDQHHRAYPNFWAWVERYLCGAYRNGKIHTLGGWPRHVARSDNPRSVVNFPVQGSAADFMRLAVTGLVRNNCPLIAVNHDSFLFDVHRRDLPRLQEAVNDILRQAADRLFPGASLTWTAEVYTDRYRDGGGKKLWEKIRHLLKGVRSYA
jgi:DNA polymerase I-like protein with 3'-5' exonuclease and polymerase domains